MIKMTLGQVANILGLKALAKPAVVPGHHAPVASNDGSYHGYLESTSPLNPREENLEFIGLCFDTRKLEPHNLFIALPGEKVDGHDFVEEARLKGARAAMVTRRVEVDLPQIVVSDAVHALGKLATTWRNFFNLPIVAVTGSNGKTTLKNMIRSILVSACAGDAEKVLATVGNLNNHLGLPLTLSRLNQNHRYAVLEMGMSHFGEIEYLTKMTRPTVALISNAAAAHLEGVGDLTGVACAKAEIFLGLAQDGMAILNRDDAFFSFWREQIGMHQYLTFGFHPDADITLATFEQPVVNGLQPLHLKTPIGTIDVELPLLGRHNTLNALAATAATLSIGTDLVAIKAGLEAIAPAQGRLQLHALPNGVKIIDDSYNANPVSMQAAVHTLRSFVGKKILVMGDMKELGPEEKLLHTHAGEEIRDADIDFLFTFGELSAHAAYAFGEGAYHFSDQTKLISALKPFLCHPATILVKGSRSMQMEEIVKGLLT
ncbi:MAG: UDP-N-acetylmuramoyl-tripeptide--D-alanyl-D-alanine ligase [Gammaproteobacteria bacterium]|nr:UDP-N-acetylmuramoyl-tripeptide--D-alanyl-D-alanine ligase [Gammaproteobacteria bacterium]